MSIKNNTTSLQEVLEILNTKAAGGEQATPEISVDSSNGLITATAGSKTTTYQMAFQGAKTITPGTMTQVAISSGHYAGGSVVVNGDDNLVASNIIKGKTIFGVSGAAETGGNAEIEDAMVTGTLTEYTNDRVEKIRDYTFCSHYSITSVNFPAVTSIGASAFYNCYNLSSINFPNAKRIGAYAFGRCGNLTSVNFPAVTSIIDCAFGSCPNLTSVNFPAAREIWNGAFANCSKLNSVNFPVAYTIFNYAFESCSSLISVYFPSVTNINIGAFRRCDGLTSVSFPIAKTIRENAFSSCSNLAMANFPSATRISSNAFNACYKLSAISFPVTTQIDNAAFYKCSSLTSIYLPLVASIYDEAFALCYNLAQVKLPAVKMISSSAFKYCHNLSHFELGANNSSVCQLYQSNAFSSTPFAGYSASFSGTPHIYVPASLVSAYQSATNWAYFSSYFSSIESLLISFTIDGDEYQAIDGMTWGEWADSEYNTNVLNADLTAYDEGTLPLQGIKEREDGTWISTPVTRSDYINKNFSYTLFDFGWN